MPKRYIDLHLHLDGSLSLDSAKQLAQIQNITLPDEDEAILNLLQAGENCRDLNDFLTKFELPQRLLQTRAGLMLAAENLLNELQKSGMIYCEIRFAPQLHLQQGLSMDEVIQAVLDGIQASQMHANCILCCMRGKDTREKNLETVYAAKRFLGKGVCALDLAGAEGLFPTADYEEIFALASELNIPFTIHAGEADGPESVRKAISFGAARIGHGVRAVEDPETVKLLRENKIPLELCPTSNLCTCIYPTLSDYPIRELMDQGVIVTINTDDMAVCGTDIANEFRKVIQEFGFSEEEIHRILLNSIEVSFASEDQKEILKTLLDHEEIKY